MKDLVVIIPLHEFNKDVEALLTKAIESVPQELEIRVSCKNGLSEDIKKTYKKHKNVVIYESEATDAPSDFCSLVNQAVGDSKWFSILEYDDVYTPIWFDNFKKYVDFYSDISVFLPLEDLIDASDNKFIGVGNEAPWASSFSNEIGYIDLDCLQNFFDFYLTGSIFNTEDWEEIGGLKPSIKLTFWYEFLLRATHNGKKIYVIPKVGYAHKLGREGSLVEGYKKTIDEKESNFWVSVAKKEYFYKEERDKSKFTYNADKEADED
jgi:hypothetical protein